MGVIKIFHCLLYANYFIRSNLNILEGFIKLTLVKGGVLVGHDVVISLSRLGLVCLGWDIDTYLFL